MWNTSLPECRCGLVISGNINRHMNEWAFISYRLTIEKKRRVCSALTLLKDFHCDWKICDLKGNQRAELVVQRHKRKTGYNQAVYCYWRFCNEFIFFRNAYWKLQPTKCLPFYVSHLKEREWLLLSNIINARHSEWEHNVVFKKNATFLDTDQ